MSGREITPDMANTTHVGKARICNFIVTRSDGSVDATTPAAVGVGNPNNLRATMNPDNPRQFAVVALAETPGINTTVTCNGHSASLLVTVVAAEGPDLAGVSIGSPGDEVDPPSWA